MHHEVQPDTFRIRAFGATRFLSGHPKSEMPCITEQRVHVDRKRGAKAPDERSHQLQGSGT